MIVRRVVAMLVLGSWLGAPAVWAQDRRPPSPPAVPAPPASPSAVDVSELPISVPRIERQLSRPSPITTEITRPMFRLGIVEKRPKWFSEIEWLPESDQRLPMPTGPAWHRDFLSMVTPQQALPFGQSTGWDLAQLMATSLVQGMVTNSVVHKVKKSAAERRASAARAEVDAAIEAWKQERNTAGQPAPPAGTGETTSPPAPSPPSSAPPR
jgi:hypothetical protein